MKTIIFRGREFAQKREAQLAKKVEKLKEQGITPKLVSILIGDDPASILYTNLKKKVANRVGAEFSIINFPISTKPQRIIQTIKQFNKDDKVHGIMVQLPLPKGLTNSKLLITNSIAPSKDVDGLRAASEFIPATVKAVVLIMKEASKYLFDKVVVVGSTGMVGKPLVKLLRDLEYKVVGVDINTKNLEEKTKKADLVISATGVPGLIKKNMVKEGVVIIDVGSPKGDVDPEVYKKASFYTPVLGGVGPVTIVSLLDNLIISTKNE